MKLGGRLSALHRRPAAGPRAAGGVRGGARPPEPERGELVARLASVEAELRRVESVLAAASTLDLDEVVAAVFRAARETDPYDAAALIVRRAVDDEPVVAAIGLEPEEVGRLAEWLRVEEASGAVVRFDYGEAADAGAVRGAVCVRLGLPGTHAVLTAAWRTQRPSEERDASRLRAVGEQFVPALRSALEHRRAVLEADRDPLTGLYNQRYLKDALAREVARADRRGGSVTLLLLDLDGFKAVNERLGHLAADRVLAEIAGAIRSAVRASEVACRAGGDEFAVVLPASTASHAASLHRRLTTAARDAVSFRVSISGGVAELLPDESAQCLFERADRALFRAKAEARGAVVIAGDSPPRCGSGA